MKRRKDLMMRFSPFLFILINVLVSAENVTTNKSESSPNYIKVTVLQPEESQNAIKNSSESGMSSFVPTSVIPNNITSQNDTDPSIENDGSAPSIAVVLQRCSNFRDKRSKQSSDLILNIPGNLTNSDESVDFGLYNEPIRLQCASGSKTMRTVKWEHGKPRVIVESKIRGVRLKGSGKTSNHFTHEGYLHIDTHYYHPNEYCVTSVSDNQVELETCDIACTDVDKICIKKCCGPDEILDYWTFRCRKLKKDEPKWFPNLHNPMHPHKAIPHERYSDRLHYQKQHLDCDEFEKWPLSKAIGAKIKTKVDPDIGWKLVPNNRPIYIAEHRKWVHIPEGIYCVDGYANWGFGGNGSYSGDHDRHSLLLLCPRKLGFVDFNEGKAWLYAVALLFSSWFLLLTAIVHLMLIDKQHLHGLTVLCHALSMFFLYIFCAIAHIVSIYPELKGTKPRAPFCMAVAILSHYFFMTTFTWLTVMNFDLWLTFRSMRPVSKMSKRIRRFRIYFLIGWGLPAILSGAFYTVDEMYRAKETEVVVPDYAVKSCFVAIWSRGEYMYSLVAIALSLNTVLVLWTFYIFYEFRKQNANTFVNRKTKSDKYSVRLFIKLFCVMGVAWFVELLSWRYNGESKPWPVVILDCVMFFQAFAIFFIFCINRRTLKQLEEKYPRLRRIIRPLQTYKWFKSPSDAEGGVEMTTPGSTPRKLSLSVTTHSRLDSTLPRKTSASSVSVRSISASSPVSPNNCGGIMEEVNLDSDDGETEVKKAGVQQAPDLISHT